MEGSSKLSLWVIGGVAKQKKDQADINVLKELISPIGFSRGEGLALLREQLHAGGIGKK